jgi:polyisoprenoid-binding protein YceI
MSSTITQQTMIPAGTWAVDPIHSSVGFSVKHLGVSTFRGTFGAFAGSLETEDGELVSAQGSVEVASVGVGDEKLTGHLLSDDFFSVDTFPAATFSSSAIEQHTGGELVIEGELRLRDVSLPVTFEGEIAGLGPDPYGNTRIGISAVGAIDRTAFGIDWNVELDNGALMLSEAVDLTLEISAVLEPAS